MTRRSLIHRTERQESAATVVAFIIALGMLVAVAIWASRGGV